MGPGRCAEIRALLRAGMCQEHGAALGEHGAARVAPCRLAGPAAPRNDCLFPSHRLSALCAWFFFFLITCFEHHLDLKGSAPDVGRDSQTHKPASLLQLELKPPRGPAHEPEGTASPREKQADGRIRERSPLPPGTS